MESVPVVLSIDRLAEDSAGTMLLHNLLFKQFDVGTNKCIIKRIRYWKRMDQKHGP